MMINEMNHESFRARYQALDREMASQSHVVIIVVMFHNG